VYTSVFDRNPLAYLVIQGSLQANGKLEQGVCSSNEIFIMANFHLIVREKLFHFHFLSLQVDSMENS